MTQRQIKALNIAGGVLLAGLVGWMVYRSWTGSDGPQLKPSLQFVCVSTGKVFPMPRDGKTMFPPLQNPETKEATLLPCEVKPDGLYVQGRYRSYLKDLGDKNKVVDPKTLKVGTPPG